MFSCSSLTSPAPGSGKTIGWRRTAAASRRGTPGQVASLLLALVLAAVALTPARAAAQNPSADRRCSPSAYGLWRIFNWHEEVTWQLTPERPRILEVSNTRERPGPGALTVSAEVTRCPEGFTPAVTLTLVDAGGRRFECPVQLRESGRRSGSALVPGFGAEVKQVLVTARLVSREGGADTGRRSVTRPARCSISVSFAPAARADQAGAATIPSPARTDATGPRNRPAGGATTVADLKPLAAPPELPPPQIEVKRVTRQTSTRDEDRTYHAFWLWSFGDGIAYPDLDPKHVISTQVHPFLTPGIYTVTATSISNKGTTLRDLHWTVVVPPPLPGAPPVPVVRVFSAETVREPEVRIVIAGPRKWVVGRPADFSVAVDFADPPHANRVSVLVDPGREFTVVWDRPGHFVVRAAAVVHLRYEFPERVVSIVNTYVKEQKVEVFATVSTD